jgi:hypothetical protein
VQYYCPSLEGIPQKNLLQQAYKPNLLIFTQFPIIISLLVLRDIVITYTNTGRINSLDVEITFT